ncbi:IS21 family transposase [Desulfobacterium sp. N47]
MDETNKIRKLYFSDGITRNEIAKKFNRSWNTIDNIIKLPREQLVIRGKRPGRKKTVATADVIMAVEGILNKQDLLHVKKKQRYTAAFIFKELGRQGIYSGTERSMRAIVKEIRKRRKTDNQQSFLPLSFVPGSSIQIDHGEADCVIGGHRVTGYLFVGSLPGLAIRYCQMYPIKSQEAWGEFHERVFRFFNGVFSTVTYDNDTVLIKEVLGDEHRQTNFSLGLEEHYLFDSIFCNIGKGNEKGAVENAVGYCRRNYLAGLPEYKTWAELNSDLENRCRKSIENGRHYRTDVCLKELLNQAAENMMPLQPEKRWVKWDIGKVNSYQVVIFDKHWYSVPERFVGSAVDIAAGVFTIDIYHDNQLIASHSRKYLKGEDSLHLDHYLDQLFRKPGALWDCAAVLKHSFESDLISLWNRLYSRMEKRQANLEFIQILLLRRKYSRDDYITAIRLALAYGAVEYAAVVNILHQLKTDASPSYNKSWFEKHHPELAGNMFNCVFDLSVYADLVKEVENVK